MNLKRTVTVGVVAVGLMCSGGYAQAAEPAQSVAPTAPAPTAQSATGSASPYAGAFGGVIDLSVPGGVRNMNNTGTKAEAGKAQPAAAKETAPAAPAAVTTAPSATGAAAK